MGRDVNHTNQGQLLLFEDQANGTNSVARQAPASLAGSYTVTELAALPASAEFLQIDNTGQLTTSVGTVGSLDDAYNGGRIITADAGPVEAAGAGGFLASHTAPVYGLETTGVERNYRVTAGQTANLFEIQIGDSDGDISDDTFDTGLVIDGPNGNLGFRVTPTTTLHADSVTGDCKLTLQSALTSDSSVIFSEDGTARWETGYDQSAGGYLVSGTAFGTLDALFVEDSTGDVGIGELTPDARLHATSSAALASLIESSNALCRLGLRASGTTDQNQVGVQADGDDLQLFAGGAVVATVDGALASIGIGVDPPVNAILHVDSSGVREGIRVTHSGTDVGVDIIHTGSGNFPPLRLQQTSGGTRGSLEIVQVTSDPSSPNQGDVWTRDTDVGKIRLGGVDRTFASPRAVPAGASLTQTIATGVVTANRAVNVIAAESGTADSVDTISVGNHEDGDRIIVRPDTGDTITFNHGTGNLSLDGASGKALNGGDQMELILNGSTWEQLTPVMNLV